MSARISFFESVVPKPYRVLGQTLRPLSIGHTILLKYFGSNFALDAEKPPGYSDLILSVFICSRTFEQSLVHLQSRLLPIKLKLWSWSCGKFDIPEAMKFFRDYVEHYSTIPQYWIEKDGTSRKAGTPFIYSLKVSLQTELGYSPSEAMNAPLSEAIREYLAHLENKGAIRLFTDQDYRMVEASKDDALARQVEAIAKRVMQN